MAHDPIDINEKKRRWDLERILFIPFFFINISKSKIQELSLSGSQQQGYSTTYSPLYYLSRLQRIWTPLALEIIIQSD
jgi:hypothetical protein